VRERRFKLAGPPSGRAGDGPEGSVLRLNRRRG
jgi:hypothetical protein